jgi:hypothetical protein
MTFYSLKNILKNNWIWILIPCAILIYTLWSYYRTCTLCDEVTKEIESFGKDVHEVHEELHRLQDSINTDIDSFRVLNNKFDTLLNNIDSINIK